MSRSDSNTDPVSKPDLDPAVAAAAVWEAAAQALAEGIPERFSDETVQQLMTAAVKLFAAKVEKEERFFRPLLPGPELVTATDVVVTVSEILRAVNLNTFDLNMWFSRPRSS